MNYAAFLNDAERGTVPPLVLLHGSDVQLLDDAARVATRALFPDPAHVLLGREVIDGRDGDAETIVRAAMTLPLATTKRLVVVRHGQVLASRGAETLTTYVTNPNPSTCLLLLADESLNATRERKTPHWLLRVIPPPLVIELPARRGRALGDWLRERASAEGLTVTEDAARLLVEWVGDDSARLLGEVRKAALAGGPDQRTVGWKEITAVVGEHRLRGVFDLTRAVERREIGPALTTLDRLLATEEPMVLLSMLAREIRGAWRIREDHRHGRSVDQIARALGRPPAAVETLLAYATQAGAALPEQLRRCWETERRLKSGGEARSEMATLVAELCRTR